MAVIVVALCVIMLATVGAGVVTAKQDTNPEQLGKSPISVYRLKATNTHGSGMGATLPESDAVHAVLTWQYTKHAAGSNYVTVGFDPSQSTGAINYYQLNSRTFTAGSAGWVEKVAYKGSVPRPFNVTFPYNAEDGYVIVEVSLYVASNSAYDLTPWQPVPIGPF